MLTNLGQTPGRYVGDIRTAAAARLLLATPPPLPNIATRCGLGTAETRYALNMLQAGLSDLRGHVHFDASRCRGRDAGADPPEDPGDAGHGVVHIE
ncbi:hypothetical protein GCM10027610_022860 [Dactylosporangium cerinum]